MKKQEKKKLEEMSPKEIDQEVATSYGKALLGALSLPYTTAIATASPERSVKKELKKALSDLPESMLNNALGLADLISDVAPDFARNNPRTTQGLGLVGDILVPTPSIASRAVALPKIIKKTGKSLEKNMLKRYIKRNIDDIDDVEKVTKLAEKFDIGGQLTKPEKLRNKLIENKKTTGAKLESTMREAADIAPPISRAQIVNRMKSDKVGDIGDMAKSGDKMTADKYADEVSTLLKAYKPVTVKTTLAPPKLPTTMPEIPTKQIDSELAALLKERDDLVSATAKRDKELADIAKKEADNAKKLQQAKKDNDAKLKDILTTQEKEIAAKRASVEREISDIRKLNETTIEEISKLKAIQAAKKAKPKLKEVVELPPDVLESLPLPERAKAIADTRMAKKALEEEVQRLQLPKVSENKIRELEESLIPEPRFREELGFSPEDIQLPLPQFPDMVPPPPIQGRELSDILADISQKTGERDKLTKANKQIAGENKAAITNFNKQLQKPQTKFDTFKMPTSSDVFDLWRTKTSIANTIPKNKIDVPLTEVQRQSAKTARETIYGIDEAISKSLDKITLPDGTNAKEVFDALSGDYNAQSILIDFLEKPTKDSYGKLFDTIGALVGAGVSFATLGAQGLPIGGLLGYKAGQIAGRSTTGGAEAAMAKAGRLMQNGPLAETVGINIPTNAAQKYFAGEPMQEMSEEEIQEMEAQETEALPEEGVKYDQKSLERFMKGRSPQSEDQASAEIMQNSIPAEVVEGGQQAPQIMGEDFFNNAVPAEVIDDPIMSKVEDTLNPQPIQMNPYVNEMVLRTPLPRDSKRILANPEALRAKIGQVAPQHLPAVEQMLVDDPELVANGLAKIAGLLPSLFENDNYGSFDGKILDPKMRDKFLNDMRADEGLSAIQKSKLALKLFRGQRVV